MKVFMGCWGHKEYLTKLFIYASIMVELNKKITGKSGRKEIVMNKLLSGLLIVLVVFFITTVADAVVVPKLVSIEIQNNEIWVVFDRGTNTQFRLERAVGADGVYQPFTPGEIVATEFPAPNLVRWRLNPAVLGTAQRTFRVATLP
ncbi:MAG TPA: hypothetical protein PJ997_00025 [Candidatus Paceibacterota bacterium]|nr:hypothetical protein [Candidatus Paceibacterota bacterium]HMP18717.1 hypothetical protein [Candidatus Paceibacterota bacterium]HMP85490.1 hypothetical protein [Candidatus Paceibacterota bacterium]